VREGELKKVTDDSAVIVEVDGRVFDSLGGRNIQKISDEGASCQWLDLPCNDSPLLLDVPGFNPESHLVLKYQNDLSVWVVVMLVPGDIGHCCRLRHCFW
jgi:hypothetical protein